MSYSYRQCLSNSAPTSNRFPWIFYPLQGATREPKCDPFCCTKPFAFSAVSGVVYHLQVLPFSGSFNHRFFGVSVRYSNRRISTGNRREAARAGSNVAPMDITIATTVIHTPSQTLRRNGTNATE
jgi:hypothetical protein